jgi:hypothetical protein
LRFFSLICTEQAEALPSAVMSSVSLGFLWCAFSGFPLLPMSVDDATTPVSASLRKDCAYFALLQIGRNPKRLDGCSFADQPFPFLPFSLPLLQSSR